MRSRPLIPMLTLAALPAAEVHATPAKRHEVHGFYREQNQIELYVRVERLLTQYMPAGPRQPERLADH